MSESDELEIPQNFSKVVLGLIAGVVVIAGVVYAAYSFSQKKGQTVLPAGFPQAPQTPQPVTLAATDCAKVTKADPANPWPFYIKCRPFVVTPDTKWKTFAENNHGFTFDVPESLQYSVYPNGMGVTYNEIQPANNLLYSIDLSSSRSGEFKQMDISNYPENYWRQFSGLTGVRETIKFTNSKNEKGVRAVYINIANETPAIDVFFEFPDRKGDFVHFGNGILATEVFNTVIDSFKFTR